MFYNALYGKFFGKSLPMDFVRTVLRGLRRQWGEVQIANIPNGFFHIRYETHEMVQKLLFEGPWIVNGLVLRPTT